MSFMDSKEKLYHNLDSRQRALLTFLKGSYGRDFTDKHITFIDQFLFFLIKNL